MGDEKLARDSNIGNDQTTRALLGEALRNPRFSRVDRLKPIFGRIGKIAFAYFILLSVTAFLGRWTPDYLAGRDLWHFAISRMVIPMIMLGVFASFMRVVPAGLMLGAILLVFGMISAIKRDATGEPFQISDLFLAGQSMHLLNYVSWTKWIVASAIIPTLLYGMGSLRMRRWSVPLCLACVMMLFSYRVEAVERFIHDHGPIIGVDNLGFNQAESERMNGIATHLYFSTAGLRLKTYGPDEVMSALSLLDVPDVAPPRGRPLPDLYIVLGEAWWRDFSDGKSPIDRLRDAGFLEGQAVSPVYGGQTANAEFEVLTGVPAKSFRPGIVPYQHYLDYLTPQARTLPRMLGEQGYTVRAFHNFAGSFWLRNKVYPLFGFQSFDSMEDMQVEMQPAGWPKDDGLYRKVLSRIEDQVPRFYFLITVATHGPYADDAKNDGTGNPGAADYHGRLSNAIDAFLDFDRALRLRGRPYVLVVFGDHLPGLREHQRNIGIIDDADPRLHEPPFLVSGNTGEASALRDRLMGRPYYCFAPLINDQLRLGITDRYFRYMTKQCTESVSPGVIPSEPVIQNQIFSHMPLH